MRGISIMVALAIGFPSQCLSVSPEPAISIRLTSPADKAPEEAQPALFSLPREEWARRYEAERIVYLPGEKARIAVDVLRNEGANGDEISLRCLISGQRRALHRGALRPGTFGPYEVVISSDFEVYQVRVQAGGETLSRPFYGIRAWRGMKDFAGAVLPHGIRLSYMNTDATGCPQTTPWDEAMKEGGVPLRAIDSMWAMRSHVEKTPSTHDDWLLWTHYACGTLDMLDGRTGLLWGEYNPLNPHLPPMLGKSETDVCKEPHDVSLNHGASWLHTDTMFPNEIFFREGMQPMLGKWADNLSEEHPGAPLTVFLGDGWGIVQGIGRNFGPEMLRFFVPWMKEFFDVTIEADTFKELVQACMNYPKHFEYFIARNTTFRSLELTVEAVRDIVANSRAWDARGESNRQLIALPEATEFCGILSRNIAVGTSDDRAAFELTHGQPLPYSLSNMIVKALAPDHNLCVGWNGCPREASDGEICRWYFEPAWLTAYDRQGRLRHVYTHSPPCGRQAVWNALLEDGASGERIRVYDRCFQLMEAIGVEKPIGPVFVCKDWTFADDRSGTAYRSDLYEPFLISLRRHKVPISCAVHADYESNVPADQPRVYAPRMDGQGRIRFGFRAGSQEKWFTCDPSEIPDSLIAEFATRLNTACRDPVVFPSGTSIEGYAFEAKGMMFIVVEEMAGREERGQIKAKAGDDECDVIDILAGERLPCEREAGFVVFDVSLAASSARLFCLRKR
jgi:hypothetical protein